MTLELHVFAIPSLLREPPNTLKTTSASSRDFQTPQRKEVNLEPGYRSVKCSAAFLQAEHSHSLSHWSVMNSQWGAFLGSIKEKNNNKKKKTLEFLKSVCLTVQRYHNLTTKLCKAERGVTYRYLRFSRSSNAPLGILRIWLLLRSLWGNIDTLSIIVLLLSRNT